MQGPSLVPQPHPAGVHSREAELEASTAPSRGAAEGLVCLGSIPFTRGSESGAQQMESV